LIWSSHTHCAPAALLRPARSCDEAEVVMRAASAFAASYQAKLSLAYVMELPDVTMETAFVPYRDDFMAAAALLN
jgi:propanediol dehydratase small subunit